MIDIINHFVLLMYAAHIVCTFYTLVHVGWL